MTASPTLRTWKTVMLGVLGLASCSPPEFPREAVLFEVATPEGSLPPDAANAGDVDRDGFDDVVIGTVRPNLGKHGVGARVFSPRENKLLLQLWTNEAQSDSTASVAAAGDTNGDGWPDLLLADAGDVRRSGTGRVWLFSGRDGALLARWMGAKGVRGFGEHVCGVGDLDGDSCAEIAIAAGESQRDEAKDGALIGGHGFVSVYSGMTHQQLFTTRGPGDGNALGGSVCALGDIDGDGRGDLALGSFAGSNVASAFFVSGVDGRVLCRIDVPDPEDGGEVAVARIPDRDADGLDECVLAYDERMLVVSPDEGRILDVLRHSSWRAKWVGDFDKDGCVDFVGGEYASRGVDPFEYTGIEARLYSGRTGEVLAQNFYSQGVIPTPFAALGDVDGDQSPDLLLVQDAVYVLSGARFFPGVN